MDHGERNWEEQFYIALATGFGLPINSVPFNLLASSIPLALLLEHRDHFPFLEAILYGQAGFLDSRKTDGPYMITLSELYQDSRSCISRRPIPEHLWKFLRLRPASFPTLRISQFAGLIHRHFPMMHLIMNAVSITEIEQLLRVRASEYWNTHYLFGKCSPESEKYTGTQFSHTMIINTVVPFLTAIDRDMSHYGLLRRGRTLLQQLEAESNQIIINWAKFGLKAGNAMESQALIQLRNAYCRDRRCLECQLGKSYIESSAEKEEG
jgi:hypothetical protein